MISGHLKRAKAADLAVVILLPIIATAITILFKTNALVSVFLFFGLPSLYLCFRDGRIVRKSLTFAVLFSIPLSLFVDVLAAFDGAWIITRSVFPFKIFGVATIEVYLYGLLWGLFAVLFYEHFLDPGRHRDGLSRHMKMLLVFFFVLVSGVIVLFFMDPLLLRIPYFYLLVGLVFIFLPLVLFLMQYPRFLPRFTAVGLYFFFFMLLYEVAALHAGQWIFPSENFVGSVQFLGVTFPLEEFVLWMIIATPGFLAYYELYADDLK